MAQNNFESLVTNLGFLTDTEIRSALCADFLIERGTWDIEQVRHASYTIRLGSRVEVERFVDARSENRQRLSIQLVKGGDPLRLRPGDTAMLYSIEHLKLPPCVLAFTVARGLLFVESLVPENTYVDPGFTGSIYTTVTNLSGRVLRIPYGTRLARLFFYRLPHDVDESYRSGSAIGIDQHLDWEPAVSFRTADDARRAKTDALTSDLERTEHGGLRTAELFRRTLTRFRVAVLTAVVLPLSLQLASSWVWLQQEAGGFLSAVLASVVAAPIIMGLQRSWERVTK